ncbi:MAG: diguanylate cyclase [Eubacteriales bacterium]|nr:diguanylate cyclase [Eubacteriales bacterium]
MDITMAEYIEINFIGIVILLVMLIHMVAIQRLFNKGANKYFTLMLGCNIVILMSDTIIYFMRWHPSAICMFISNLMSIIFYGMAVLFGYLWLMYTLKRLYSKFSISLKTRFLLLVPCFLCWIVIISSPWTKLIFYFTEQNRYVRGNFMWLTMFVLVSYWMASFVITLREMKDPGYEREHNVYVTLLTFPIPAIIGNFIQLKFYGVSVVWICTTITLMIVFISMQNIQISRDMLTGLFNRRETDKHIEWELKKFRSADYKLFIMMIDVDYFKQINDRYGHLEGDKALIDVADILRNSFRTRDFIGRFGGDEFIVIGRLKKDDNVDTLIKNIHDVQTSFNDNAETYKLSLSTGYVVYDSAKNLTTDKVIADADEKMYSIKKKRHSLKA